MILIIRNEDLKPGCDKIATEHIQLSTLNSETYAFALRAKRVILMLEDSSVVKVLKDHRRDSSGCWIKREIFPRESRVLHLLITFGVIWFQDHDVPCLTCNTSLLKEFEPGKRKGFKTCRTCKRETLSDITINITGRKPE